jgi:nitrite reductase/ring-hydroxylating ferredoxin subunit/uncharacterized membrane protein
MPATTAVSDVVEAIENAGPLDAVAKVVRKAVSSALRPRKVKDVLHGVPLGHPLHPMLTDVPIGMFTAAAVLDALPGTAPAATALVATGLAAVGPTALAGWADWAELDEQQQRVGLVHAAANVAGAALYALSLAARMRSRGVRGRAFGYAGLATITAGGYLGGHLSYRQAAGVNHVEDVPHRFPTGWQPVGPVDELPDGELAKRTVGGVDLLIMRRGSAIDALADKCSHLSGPLSDGSFSVADGQGCVVCPWHGSTFRLSDGAVVHGPATAPQPRFSTRVRDGRLEVMFPGAG